LNRETQDPRALPTIGALAGALLDFKADEPKDLEDDG